MLQKVIQIGNSSGITLPQSIRQEVGLMPGDNIEIRRKGSQIIISPVKKVKTGGVDAKFMKMVDEFINEHEDVLHELSKR